MRTFKTTGIIVKRRNMGEADRILTIFTKDQGKIQVKAKGVRKITSHRSSSVETINYCTLGLYKGQGMAVLTEIQASESFQSIKADLYKTGFAYHICELIEGLCPEEQENEQVFSLLLSTLHKLNSEDDVVLIIHDFEVELLSLLGYWSSSEFVSSQQTESIIESILERKLKTRQILPQLQ